jgi:hypothetical protein
VAKAGSPWKISCLTATPFGLFAAIYNNNTRNKSQLFRDGKFVKEFPFETLGQGTVSPDGSVWFAGECGRLVRWRDGQITLGMELKYSTCTGIWQDKAIVINTPTNNQIAVHDCIDGQRLFGLPGGGIATQCAVRDGKLYAATCDYEGTCGVACSDGKVIRLPACQCIVNFNGHLIATSKNSLYAITSDMKAVKLADAPVEKFMHMHVSADNRLWIAGVNPDCLWAVNPDLTWRFVGWMPHGNRKIGGSVFWTRITDGYWGRGLPAELYSVTA